LTDLLFILEWGLIFATSVALYVGTVRAEVGGTTPGWRWLHWSLCYPLGIAMTGRTAFSLMLFEHKSPDPNEFLVLGIIGVAVLAVGIAVMAYVKSNAEDSAPR
jgi:hypothetical protein